MIAFRLKKYLFTVFEAKVFSLSSFISSIPIEFGFSFLKAKTNIPNTKSVPNFLIQKSYKVFTIPKITANKKVLKATFFNSPSNSDGFLFLATLIKFFINGINAIKYEN